jgi:hypothetical protein
MSKVPKAIVNRRIVECDELISDLLSRIFEAERSLDQLIMLKNEVIGRRDRLRRSVR